jgi:hypothetical protein
MKIPTVRGVIDRRILVNFQVEPEALQRVLPAPLRPKLVAGMGIGGICLIRLRELRPRLVPRAFGVGSENAAHRIAVVLPDGGEGVFIPRRDTTSVLNVLAGGRLFPGRHHLGRFEVEERGQHYAVRLEDQDSQPILSVEADLADRLPETSVFDSLEEASAFFEAGSLGYSPSADGGRLDGLELRTHGWHVRPLAVQHVESSFFEDRQRFPEGSARFDSALLMRDLQHEWHAREPLYSGEERRTI